MMALTSAPILCMPTDDGPYRVEADSSDYATGVVLSQEQDGHWYPIAYMSRSLNEVERNYPIYNKELLAVVRALEEWRHYLEGAMHRFEVLTDVIFHSRCSFPIFPLNSRFSDSPIIHLLFDYCFYFAPALAFSLVDSFHLPHVRCKENLLYHMYLPCTTPGTPDSK